MSARSTWRPSCRTLFVTLTGVLAGCVLNASLAASAAEIAPRTPQFRDFSENFVPDQLIVMFRDDVGRHAKAALNRGFAQLSRSAAAASLDDLMREHRVRGVERVFRGLEDARGGLRTTARQRAIAQRGRHIRRAARLGALDRIPKLENVFLLELAANSDVAAVAADFARDPHVVYAHPNFLYRLQAQALPSVDWVPDDPFVSGDGTHWSQGAFGQSFPDLYGLRNIRALEAWNLFDSDGSGDFEPGETRPGEGVVVAVVDTGLDATHPDGVRVWTNPGETIDGSDDDSNGFIDDVNGWDFVDSDRSPDDPNGHGTHVAGTIGAAPDNATGLIGVAPWAEIMPVRGLNENGSGSSSDLAAAVDYAVDMGADVLSNSWGGAGSDPTISAAFANAYSQGVLAVASAGNSDGDASMFSPANIDTVLAVAAVDEADVKASFSNSGFGIDLAAPGVDTLSLSANHGNNRIIASRPSAAVGFDYMVISGTSMACPHVSGAAAVLISRFAGESIDELRGRLRAGADPIDAANPEHVGRFGGGRLNLLTSATATPTPVLSIDLVETAGFTTRSSMGTIVVTLRNSWLGVTNLQGVLSTANPGVAIQNGTAGFGDIPIARTASNSAQPFEIRFDTDAPSRIDFELTLSSPGYQTTLTFAVSRAIFENVSQSAQLPSGVYIPYHTSIQDYGGDLYPDVSLSDGLTAGQRLFENQRDGSFVQADSHPDYLSSYRVLMIDIDSDGDQDLVLSPITQQLHTNLLLRNDDGTFIDITAGSGIPAAYLSVMAAMDFDGDGLIDIVGGGSPTSDSNGVLRSTWMLRNDGDGTFTDVFAQSGLNRLTFALLHRLDTVDYDDDGDLDLVVVGVDPPATRSLAVYQNDGSGFFTDVTALAFTDPQPRGNQARAVALATGDYDDDGDLDLFVNRQTIDRTLLPNALYRNNGDGTFTDVIDSTGELATTNIHGIYWGTEFFDYDNDGDLDLYIARDATSPRDDLVETRSHTLLRNNGDGTFDRVNDLAFPLGVRPNVGTAAIGDYDLDGWLDIYAPASSFGGNVDSEGGLLRNGGAEPNHWLHVDLEGVTSNRDGYGARVVLKLEPDSQIREVHTSAVDPGTVHFGLGRRERVDVLEVHWPSGIVQRLAAHEIPIDSVVHVRECSDGDGDGVCNPVDNCLFDPNPDQGDVDGDGVGDACDVDIDGDDHPNESDNCVMRANPHQDDTDGDGCGNVCDADYDQSGMTDLGDLGMLSAGMFLSYDLRGDHSEPIRGPVGFADFGMFRAMFAHRPGPSGTTTGSPACEAWR